MVTLGLDIFSLRSQGWTPFQQIDFSARHGFRVLHYSEERLIGGWDPAHLERVRNYAAERGIALELGMLSICPSSCIFKADQGTAEDQLARALEAARIVRSPFVRCVVGTIDDRRAPGGIERRIDDTVAVLRRMRTRIADAGLRIAVENHAGDMQARELRQLVEDAGTDIVGVCIDAGNAVWALEDPHLTLETLAPYVLTSHTRDSACWTVPDGAAVTWTRMGEGRVEIGRYLDNFVERCPSRTLSLEIIVTPQPRIMRYRDRAFWEAYRHTPAWEFERFLELAGGPPIPAREGSPEAHEVEDVEASVRWTREYLGDRLA